MGVVDKIQEFFKCLQLELEKITPSIEGTVSYGSVKFPNRGPGLRVQFPGMKGVYDTLSLEITFSIVSDFSQLVAMQPVNKPTVTELDYLRPWLQLYTYQQCPFVLRITPERKDIMTKITRALGLESRELKLGWSEFDNRYFLGCRSGKGAAEAFLRMPGIRENIETLGTFHLLRFEEAYIKLVTSVEEPQDYKAGRILHYIRILSRLASPLR